MVTSNNRCSFSPCVRLLAIIVPPIILTVVLAIMLVTSVPSLRGSLHAFVPLASPTPTASCSTTPMRLSPPFITLTYNQSVARIITHNCRLIKKNSHHFVIYTDDTAAAYCSLCECRPFRPTGCGPPDPEQCEKEGRRNYCEKMLFVVSMIHKYPEFVLLDNDLVIVKESFFPRFLARTQHHDFLASYGHSYLAKKYRQNFNSGLMFIRRLPHLDYNWMELDLHPPCAYNDQAIMSRFVQKHYDNWDVLSYKWHCRWTNPDFSVDPKDCYSIHDKVRGPPLFKTLNFSLLKI